jgi:hypothetical protein
LGLFKQAAKLERPIFQKKSEHARAAALAAKAATLWPSFSPSLHGFAHPFARLQAHCRTGQHCQGCRCTRSFLGGSQAVRALEAQLGAVLIQRTTRRMSLTDTGRAYYAECCRLLDDFDTLEQSVRSPCR